MSDTATNHKPTSNFGGAMAVAGAFGCNGTAAQVSAAVPVAIVTTAATQTTPFGFTTAAQYSTLITLVNTMRAALIANGIVV